MPDAVDRQDLVVDEVAHDVFASDPLTHAAGLVDLPANLRLIDQRSERAPQHIDLLTRGQRIVVGDESAQPLQISRSAIGKT